MGCAKVGKKLQDDREIVLKAMQTQVREWQGVEKLAYHSTAHKGVSKPMGFKIASSGDFPPQHANGRQNQWVSKSQVLGAVKTQNSGAPAILVPMWVVFWHPKSIKTDGFQNGKFWGLSKLVFLVHQQFWYPFGCFRFQLEREELGP